MCCFHGAIGCCCLDRLSHESFLTSQTPSNKFLNFNLYCNNEEERLEELKKHSFNIVDIAKNHNKENIDNEYVARLDIRNFTELVDFVYKHAYTYEDRHYNLVLYYIKNFLKLTTRITHRKLNRAFEAENILLKLDNYYHTVKKLRQKIKLDIKELNGEISAVGSYPPNAFGLYDMHGNVREWCADIWHDNYSDVAIDGDPWLEDRVNCQEVVEASFQDEQIFVPLTSENSGYYRYNCYEPVTPYPLFLKDRGIDLKKVELFVVRGGSYNSLLSECASDYRDSCIASRCSQAYDLSMFLSRSFYHDVGFRVACAL